MAWPKCRHCDEHDACIRNDRVPMLCFRCGAKPRVYEQYALPPERVVAIFTAALDQMVLEAIERGRTLTPVLLPMLPPRE